MGLRGERHPHAKLDAETVRRIRKLLGEGMSGKDVALEVGIGKNTVSLIKRGKRWAHITCLAAGLVAAPASASESHAAWTKAALYSLPRYFEDRGPELEQAKTEQLDRITSVVALVSTDKAPRSPREWAALLLTVGYHESTFSLRIHRGDCKPKECDAGRARSAWQLHRNLFTAPVWDQLFGLEHTEVQVRTADQALRRAYWTCARSGEPWLTGTLNAYAGKRCGAHWPGLKLRAATFNRLVRVSVPKGGQ